jgi:hypothetical protein
VRAKAQLYDELVHLDLDGTLQAMPVDTAESKDRLPRAARLVRA